MRPTSTTGELIAIYQALAWIRKRRKTLPPDILPRYNLVSDSYHCVKLFANRSIKPVANTRLIARINVLLNQVKRDNDISISWTPAHTAADTSLARGNAEADKLAAKGRTARRLETLTRGPCSLPSSPLRDPWD